MKIKIHLQRIIINQIVGFFLYLGIEAIFRTVTGQTSNENAYLNLCLMGFLGGLVFNILSFLDQFNFFNDLPFKIKSILGGVIITACEFFAGVLINRILGLNGWDYYDQFLGNIFLGQICLKFFIIWILATPFIYWLDSFFDEFERLCFALNSDGIKTDMKDVRMTIDCIYGLGELINNYSKLLFFWGKKAWIK